MEKKLKKLFDYQRFEKNERLEKIIKETESRYGGELSDDDLSLVNAAGETGGSIGGLTGDFTGNYTIPGKTQVGGLPGGLPGGLSGENNSGSVSGNNTGGLTGSLSDEVGGFIGMEAVAKIPLCNNKCTKSKFKKE